VVAVIIVSAIFHFRPMTISTAVGEQRVMSLEDGTRISLNTSSRAVIRYEKKRRHVILESGEAFFEVAKIPNWPFVVSVGNREVTALGTTFLVRTDLQQVAVTLLEGRVAVAPADASVPQPGTTPSVPTILGPGERATFMANQRSARLDRPALEMLTAWQRGRVLIEDLTLEDAVAEMNRYSTLPLVIERPEAQHLRVSGIFRAGDSLSFAMAVAQTYGLTVEQQSGRILLSGPRHPKP